MKVYIGPYITWLGPYQIADMIPFISEERKDKIGNYLSKTWVDRFCNWVYEKLDRKIKVIIHDYDVWNADSTLSLIILPLLKKLKENKQGSSYVDNEDVPPELRYDDPKPGYDDNGNWVHRDGNWVHYKWEWVLNEIIWAFEQLNTDWEEQFIISRGEFDWNNDSDVSLDEWLKEYYVDIKGRDAHQKRIDNGLRLFGKYYQCLWS